MIAIPANLDEIPDTHGVYLVQASGGQPYLGRTRVLRRRVRRLVNGLGASLRAASYQPTGSRLESQLLVLDLARQHLGSDYREAIRLRPSPWIKLTLSNPFPRTTVTSKIGNAPALYYGPFRNRSTAARFESEVLDLFQLRRCQEDLAPAPEHPGCMYGEMGKCLRPCQQVVGREEYSAETARLAAFLKTSGRSLSAPLESERERLSAEMDFESAAIIHQRSKRIGEVVAERDEMCAELDLLNAIAVVPSAKADSVNLGWLRGGYWRGFSTVEFQITEGKPYSLDARLRELATAIPDAPESSPRERVDRLAVVARWRYSSFCDGELLMVEDWEKIPYRRLVNAVARIAHQKTPQATRKPD